MKMISLFLLIFLVACGENNPYQTPTNQTIIFGTDSTFEVVTWNLENFPKRGATTINLVSQFILQIDAEIYALQEIENSFETLLQTVNELDTLNNWSGFRSNSAAFSINLAYIYKSGNSTNIAEILDSDYHYLPRPPLLMNLIFEGSEFVVINNHLKAGGDAGDIERRTGGCLLLEDYLSQNLPSENVILLGDLNDMLTDVEEDNVFKPFLDEMANYQFVDMEIAEGNSVDWSYPGWPSHIDHILITNELYDEFNETDSEVRTLKIDEYLENGWNEYEQNISDHRPVGIKLKIGE